jgi:hypothetical protein
MSGTRTATVIAIGNSDDRLTQREWSAFWAECNDEIQYYGRLAGVQVHGTWLSEPNSPYQNAGWSLSWPDELLYLSRDLKNQLREILPKYRQESLAWTTGTTTLIPGRDPARVRAITPGRWTCGCNSADCDLQWTEIGDGQPDPLVVSRLTCVTHTLAVDSQPFLASLGDSEERRRSQALYHMDLAHQEQCR